MTEATNQRDGIAVSARLTTLSGAAAALHLGLTTIREMVDRGDLRTIRIGRAVRIPVSELDRIAGTAGTGADAR